MMAGEFVAIFVVTKSLGPAPSQCRYFCHQWKSMAKKAKHCYRHRPKWLWI